MCTTGWSVYEDGHCSRLTWRFVCYTHDKVWCYKKTCNACVSQAFYFWVGGSTCNGGNIQHVVQESVRCCAWGAKLMCSGILIGKLVMWRSFQCNGRHGKGTGQILYVIQFMAECLLSLSLALSLFVCSKYFLNLKHFMYQQGLLSYMYCVALKCFSWHVKFHVYPTLSLICSEHTAHI